MPPCRALDALLEKVFKAPEKAPEWEFLVAVAFVGFFFCIIASLIMMRTISLKMGSAYESAAAKKFQKIEDWVFPMAAGTFLFAIGTLVVFVIINL